MPSDKILRCFGHDYHSRCIYMITLKKEPSLPDWTNLEADPRIFPSISKTVSSHPTPLGLHIITSRNFLEKYVPGLKILQYVLMPDHFHILIFIQQTTVLHLSSIIAAFKVETKKTAFQKGFLSDENKSLFTENYNDRILFKSRNLKTYINYIGENPYRLLVRRALKPFFTKKENVRIGDLVFSLYGNLELLKNPFKHQVIFHRRDSDKERYRKKYQYNRALLNNDVLIGPFISADEKTILKVALGRDGKIIYLVPGNMPEKFKPSGKLHQHCEKGLLLLVFVGEAKTEKRGAKNIIPRKDCLLLNEKARLLAKCLI